MKMRLIILALFLWAFPVNAQQYSTINPLYPGPSDDITSYGLRTNFLAAYDDINRLFQEQGGIPSIGANQVLGALIAGPAAGLNVPNCNLASQALIWTGGAGFGCHTIAGSGVGTVTSVGFVGDGVIFSVTPSTPVTDFGNISPTLLPQTANHFFVGPATGSAALPSYRAMVGADLIPPGASSLGAIFSSSAPTHQFSTGVNTSGVTQYAQPGFTDLSGGIAVSQMDSGTNASATTFFNGAGHWVELAPAPTTQTTSFVLAVTDKNGFIIMNSASALTVTVPPNSSVAFPLGAEITVMQAGLGAASFVAGAGVTISSPSTLVLLKQNATASIKKIATDTWVLAGAIQ